MTTVRVFLALAFAAGVVTVHAQEQKWTVPRTPWGDPDLQGAWARRLGGIAEANAPRSPLGDFSATGNPYPTIFNQGVVTSLDRNELARRKTGVIDPADRVLPWRPEADKARREHLSKMIPPASLKHVEAYARCVPPGPIEGDDRHPHFIVQRPGAVVLAYEYNHVTRVIRTDGTPPLGKKIRLFMGDSVGHWEGDTLVFDTLSTKNSQWPSSGDTVLDRTGLVLSDAAHVTTRLRRLDAQTMEARMVIEDPKALTAPWNVTKTYRKAPEGTRVYDYGCAENNRNPVDAATGKTLILGPEGQTFGK